MKDIMTRLQNLNRPKLLIRAARFGLGDYRRERDLRRIARCTQLVSPQKAVESLLEEETWLEDKRKAGDASYRITRHIDVLIALMAESRLLRMSL